MASLAKPAKQPGDTQQLRRRRYFNTNFAYSRNLSIAGIVDLGVRQQDLRDHELFLFFPFTVQSFE